MSTQSPQNLFNVVRQGRGEMPDFTNRLSEEESWQVVDYVRSLSYEAIAEEGVIVGQVKNGTTGQAVGDMEVVLHRWQTETELPPLAMQADVDGRFRFEGLDTQSHAFYRLEVMYDGIPFPSEFVGFEPGASQLTLPVSVYETTTSDEDVRVERFHFIIIGDQPGFLSVLELYQFGNLGDRAYVGTPSEGGLRETVGMALPAGAQELVLQNGTLGVDFLETDEGLVATSPVIPGGETFEVAFLYVVPYGGANLNLDRPLLYDTASVNALLMDVGAKLESDLLDSAGQRTAQGQNFLQYTGENLKAGETLPIRLEGLDKIELPGLIEPPGGPSRMPSTSLSQTNLLWLMLALGGLAIVVALVYPSMRLRFAGEAPDSKVDLTQERKRLLLTLARLDEAYEAGDLNETVYRRARARHKAELSDLLRRMQEEEI
jgi:hypothetical protein